jgi:hypothetical protein
MPVRGSQGWWGVLRTKVHGVRERESTCASEKERESGSRAGGERGYRVRKRRGRKERENRRERRGKRGKRARERETGRQVRREIARKREGKRAREKSERRTDRGRERGKTVSSVSPSCQSTRYPSARMAETSAGYQRPSR